MKTEKLNPKFSFLLSMLIFGSLGLFVKEIPLSSPQIAMVRGIIGCIFLFLAGIISKQRFSFEHIKENFLLLLFSGIALGFNWACLFEAYQYTSVQTATICYYFAPVFILLLSPFVLKERLSFINILAITGAVLGMFFVMNSGGSKESSTHLLGIGFGLLAALGYTAVVLLNKFQKNLTGMESTFVQLFIAACSLFLYLLFTNGLSFPTISIKSSVMLLVVGVIHTGLAFFLYFSSIPHLKSQTLALFSYVDPISAIIFSSLFLQERLTPFKILGGILIFGAAYISDRFGAKTKKELS